MPAPLLHLVDCSLGRLGVVASDDGIHEIALGDDDAAVSEALHLAVAMAEPSASVGRQSWLDAVRAAVDGDTADAVPLVLSGTPFQHSVWRRLQDIPAGTTLTYTTLAAQLSDANAVRAVAGACAANRHAVLIPCHRVVRSDGGLAGFRWGVARKRALLAREAGADTWPVTPQTTLNF